MLSTSAGAETRFSFFGLRATIATLNELMRQA
jgi:hypothetical protein